MVLCNLITPPDSRVTFHKTSTLFPKIVRVSGDFISIYKMSLDVPVRGVLYCDSCCGTGPPPSLYPIPKTIISMAVIRNFHSTKIIFSSKGHAIPVVRFSTVVFKSHHGTYGSVGLWTAGNWQLQLGFMFCGFQRERFEIVLLSFDMELN